MENDDKLKIAFVFGAGAESGKENFGVKNGFEYLQSSILGSVDENKTEFDKMTKALKKFYNNKVFFQDKYPYTYSIDSVDAVTEILNNYLIYKSDNDEHFLEENKKEIDIICSKTKLKEIYGEKYEKKITDNSEKEKIISEFKKIITGSKKNYNEINYKLFKNLFTENNQGKIDIDYNIGIGGILDEYFHTISNPKKYGPVKFSKILNYYWACYFSILSDVLIYLNKTNSQMDVKYLFTEENKIDYEKVLEQLPKLTNYLYECELIIPETSYYKLIIDKLKEQQNKIECKGVATTNYYKFCSEISENIIYLNGELKLFEYPEILKVDDFSYKNYEIIDSKLCFPFIFGQSLIKPTINQKQIKEFFNFSKLLDESDILVILGYNINEDDNHINTMLRDYVISGHQLVIVTDKKRDDFGLNEKLKLDESDKNNANIHILTVEYGDNKKVIDSIFYKVNEICYKNK